jgi:hypothetical protein
LILSLEGLPCVQGATATKKSTAESYIQEQKRHRQRQQR